MPDRIDFNAKALVVLFPDHQGRGEALNWKTTLAEAVRHVRAMSPEDRLRAKISIDKGVVPGSTLLGIKEISELHRRPDFPRRKD